MLAVSDGDALAGGTIEDWAAELERCGVDAMEIRNKKATDRDLYAMAKEARTVSRRTKVLVNRRPDIALAVGADGVHLPHDGFPIDRLRPAFPAGWLIGRSTHSIEEVAAAQCEGADYALFGPVYPTPSKPGALATPRLEELARACELGLPILAIGGVERDNLSAIANAGAYGVAAIRYFAAGEGLAERVDAVRGAFAP